MAKKTKAPRAAKPFGYDDIVRFAETFDVPPAWAFEHVESSVMRLHMTPARTIDVGSAFGLMWRIHLGPPTPDGRVFYDVDAVTPESLKAPYYKPTISIKLFKPHPPSRTEQDAIAAAVRLAWELAWDEVVPDNTPKIAQRETARLAVHLDKIGKVPARPKPADAKYEKSVTDVLRKLSVSEAQADAAGVTTRGNMYAPTEVWKTRWLAHFGLDVEFYRLGPHWTFLVDDPGHPQAEAIYVPTADWFPSRQEAVAGMFNWLAIAIDGPEIDEDLALLHAWAAEHDVAFPLFSPANPASVPWDLESRIFH